MSNLVERLCQGDHPVEFSLRPEKTIQEAKSAIDRGYVHIKFTDTKGGTELGVRLDRDASDLSNADFVNHNGQVKLVGALTLDYVKVLCTAEIDLKTFEGKGHLTRVEN